MYGSSGSSPFASESKHASFQPEYSGFDLLRLMPMKEKEWYPAPPGISEIVWRMPRSSGVTQHYCTRYPSIEILRTMAVVVNSKEGDTSDIVRGVRDCLNILGNFFWPATTFCPPAIFLTWLTVNKNIDGELIYYCHIPIQYVGKQLRGRKTLSVRNEK